MIAATPPENYPPTGIAFNYLAWFWLEKRYLKAKTYPWQAEYGVQKLQKWAA